ncbi:MAG: cupin domain-containing protein [Chitinivibrionales bacterium]|nr:cupin domain-containing protein [Chitinivibrionales bacterium]
MSLGARIRKIRMQQNRTLQQIAERVGLTRSMLSKVETDKVVPTVATLTKIAGALGVSASVLLEQGNGRTTVYAPATRSDPAAMVQTERGYRFHTFATERADKGMQPYLFTARKGEVKPQALSHEGEEFVFMLEGEMRYRVGDIEYTLRPGDSLYFDSEDEHEVRPISDEVRYLAVFASRAGGGGA